MLVYSDSRHTENQYVNETTGWEHTTHNNKVYICCVFHLEEWHLVRMCVAGRNVHTCCAQTLKLPSRFSPAGGSLNYEVWKMTLASLYWQYQLFSPLLSIVLTTWPCVCVCVCVTLCCFVCGCARTLCAGTRLTRTVSSSSCDTVSPSQMMELIRSTICMCTFWLWPLLGKQDKRGQRSRMTYCIT